MSEIILTDANFKAEVLESAIPVMVDFWAPWCGPCRMLAPIVEELAAEYEGRIKVCKLNTDEGQETSVTFKIAAIPTIKFFKGGQEIHSAVGVQPKPELKKVLDGLLA
ncbi:MAG: thioredoxin [Elusimicrobiaceae bacterium]|nr:thioredoxin [Elusimicrobiaceae bacterium]